MKYYIKTEETIGLDYFADVAQNIVDAREKAGLTQEQLAKKLKWKKSRLAAAENVRIRLRQEDVEQLAKALGVELDWLINAEHDAKGEECLYLIWINRHEDFKLYWRGTSPQDAYFRWYSSLRNAGVRVFESQRENAKVRLAGVPVSEKEIKAKYNSRDKSEDEELPGVDGHGALA